MSLLAVKEKGRSFKCISNKPGFFFLVRFQLIHKEDASGNLNHLDERHINALFFFFFLLTKVKPIT